MPFIAIIHIPDHTADPRTIAAEIEVRAGAHVVGVFDFPNRADMTCSGNCVRKGSGAWRRDPKGFMKCSICGSRNRKLRQWFTNALFDWFGSNQLGDDAPAAFRTPSGYGPFPR